MTVCSAAWTAPPPGPAPWLTGGRLEIAEGGQAGPHCHVLLVGGAAQLHSDLWVWPAGDSGCGPGDSDRPRQDLCGIETLRGSGNCEGVRV